MIGAIEAGGTKFVLAVADPQGTIVTRARIETTSPSATFGKIREFFAAAATYGALSAIGIASFGPLDIDPLSPGYGTFSTTPKPGWSGASYHDALGELGVPIAIDTDVNGAALGEWTHGAGRGLDTIAYTTIGTGIGTGIVQRGRPLGGFSHYESGHMPVSHDRAADPFAGICPYHGDCLEGLASGPAIAARWGHSLSESGEHSAAIALIADYVAHLAATLVLLHMPDRLIFGGGVMKAPGMLCAVRRRTQAKLAGYVAHARLDTGLERYIAAPALGDDSGITGAIALGRNITLAR